MVKGRLKRESNPVPGEKPGFTPQHDSTGQGDFVETSPINPFPVTGKVTIENQKETQNIDGEVEVTNLPTDYPDAQVKAELVQIKQTQSQILTRMEEAFDIRGAVQDQDAINELQLIKQTQSDILQKLNAGLDTNLVGQSVEDFLFNQKEMIGVLSDSAAVFGAYWDKSASPILTRTDAAEGLVANVGVDGELVVNDFDKAPIFKKIGEVTDVYGNEFVRIPKFYIRKKDGKDFRLWQISETKYPGFYLPAVFWDFENEKELPYYDHGKYKASLSDDNKLESKPGKHPLVSTNIVQFRNHAEANNVDGQVGYQQLDIHAQDVLQVLFLIEFATLDSQSIMNGFVSGAYSSAHEAVVTEASTNRIIVPDATAASYLVGQSIGIGSSNASNSVSETPRVIVEIDTEYDLENTAIVFDGEPVDITIGDVVANRGYVNGFSSDVLASSGSIVSNEDGKHPCVYRGIESPWGDVYQFADGININDHQAWLTRNAKEYASNVFAFPYEELGYINNEANGYISEMGYDPKLPFAEFPTEVGGGTTTYYADYYYQATGQRIARVGGIWSYGARNGLRFWNLSNASGIATVNFGGRLLKKAS